MAKKTEIIISGGGIAGLCLAALLARHEISVLVIDPAKPPAISPHPTGRTAAIMQYNIDVLIQAGLPHSQLTAMGQAMSAMRLIEPDGNTAAHDQTFHAAEIGQTAFGLNLPNDALHIALWNLCHASPFITLCMEAAIASLTHAPASIIATLTSGETVAAQLLIGADGRNSAVRRLSGITVQEKQYPEAALTCLLSHTLPHNDTSTEIHYRGGPFTMVPFQGQTSALVYVDAAEKLNAISAQDLIPYLQEKSRNILGELTLETKPAIWPLMTLRADTLIAPRVALVAEAAHVLSPIGAQGLNLSLQDVQALYDTIARAVMLGLDIGHHTVLAQYAEQRAQDINTRTFGVDLFHRSVASQSGWPHHLRMMGAGLVDSIPALKRRFAKLGLGSRRA